MNKIKIFCIILIMPFFLLGCPNEVENKIKRKVGTFQDQNLTITVYTLNGDVIRKFYNIQKITSGGVNREYVYFYTSDDKYVQVSNSALYIAEEYEIGNDKIERGLYSRK